MEKVELHPAHTWDCPDCGKENFCRGVTVEMTEEDIAGQIEMYGGEPEDWRTGHWITKPDIVTCVHCGVEFETEDMMPLEDEDGPDEGDGPE